MGNRISRIVTRLGDDGTTGLGDGIRVRKNALRIQAIGDVDELNSHIGLLLTEVMLIELQQKLNQIQHDLFDLGAELSVPGSRKIIDEQIWHLEKQIEESVATLPSLREFILPGGSKSAAQAHVCRAVCRRAERSVVSLRQAESISELACQYLNRLSDWFFVLARLLNVNAGKNEIFWKNRRSQDGK